MRAATFQKKKGHYGRVGPKGCMMKVRCRHTHKNNVYLRIESEMSLEMGINDFIC